MLAMPGTVNDDLKSIAKSDHVIVVSDHPPPGLLPSADTGAVLGQAGRGSLALAGPHRTLGCVLRKLIVAELNFPLFISSFANFKFYVFFHQHLLPS